MQLFVMSITKECLPPPLKKQELYIDVSFLNSEWQARIGIAMIL